MFKRFRRRINIPVKKTYAIIRYKNGESIEKIVSREELMKKYKLYKSQGKNVSLSYFGTYVYMIIGTPWD